MEISFCLHEFWRKLDVHMFKSQLPWLGKCQQYLNMYHCAVCRFQFYKDRCRHGDRLQAKTWSYTFAYQRRGQKNKAAELGHPFHWICWMWDDLSITKTIQLLHFINKMGAQFWPLRSTALLVFLLSQQNPLLITSEGKYQDQLIRSYHLCWGAGEDVTRYEWHSTELAFMPPQATLGLWW